LAQKSIKLDSLNFEISYEILNKEAKKDLIIIHGWGANKELMKNVFSPYLKNFRHIYIDLPGFGKSSNEYILDVYKYAEIINKFLSQINAKKDLIMGHSYGGKVATLLNPDILILLSTAGILEEKSFSVKIKIILAKVFNNLGLKTITKVFRSKDVDKMSENMYSTFKNVVNEDFTKEFENYKKNAMIFWGEDDKATSLSSGKKINSLIKNSSFNSYADGHYFFLKYSQDISNRIKNGIEDGIL
jgi:pimeloyl-ACP methyl ester carboxylesterase